MRILPLHCFTFCCLCSYHILKLENLIKGKVLLFNFEKNPCALKLRQEMEVYQLHGL